MPANSGSFIRISYGLIQMMGPLICSPATDDIAKTFYHISHDIPSISMYIDRQERLCSSKTRARESRLRDAVQERRQEGRDKDAIRPHTQPKR